MDGNRFDDVVRRLSGLASRRGVIGLLAALGSREVGEVAARKHRKRDNDRRQEEAETECTGTGGPCAADDECCSARCSADERGDPPARRCCQPKGKPCKRHSQCCSGRCQGERCVAAPGGNRDRNPDRNPDATRKPDADPEPNRDPSVADPDAGTEPDPEDLTTPSEGLESDRRTERMRAESETGCPPCTACHYDTSTGDGGCDGTCADPCLATTLRKVAVKNKTYKKLDAFLRSRGFGAAGEAEASTFTENGTLDSQSVVVAYGNEAAIVYTRVGRKGWAYAVTETAGETRVYVAGKKGKITQLAGPTVLPEGVSPAAATVGGEGRAGTRSVNASGVAQDVLCTDVYKKPEIKDIDNSRIPFIDVGGPTTACEWLCGKVVKFVVCKEGSLVRKLVNKASIAARCARVHPLYGPPACLLVETVLCDLKVLSKVSCKGICSQLDCPECGLPTQWFDAVDPGCRGDQCCDGKCQYGLGCPSSPEQISPANPVDPCASCAANHTCCNGRCCAPGEGCYSGVCQPAGECGCRAGTEICCEGRCCYWDEKCCGSTCCGADEHCCGSTCCDAHKKCWQGQCVDCRSDSDCGPGKTCQNGTCSYKCGGPCQYDRATDRCVETTCTACQRCDKATDQCVPDIAAQCCTSDSDCPSGTCSRKYKVCTCRQDADCATYCAEMRGRLTFTPSREGTWCGCSGVWDEGEGTWSYPEEKVCDFWSDNRDDWEAPRQSLWANPLGPIGQHQMFTQLHLYCEPPVPLPPDVPCIRGRGDGCGVVLTPC